MACEDRRRKYPAASRGGENYDGGEIGLEIYDSENRQLQKLPVQADGVWEREPAKIRVVIDQAKINEGFQKTQQQINQKITEYKLQLEQAVSGEDVKNIAVTASPGWITDAKSLAVYTPALLDLQVTGPGIPQQWQVASTSMGETFVHGHACPHPNDVETSAAKSAIQSANQRLCHCHGLQN